MITLFIPDMTCNHCIKTISTAIAALDADARLDFDLEQHTLRVDSTLESTKLVLAIRETGYSVREPEAGAEPANSCCGSCGI